MRGFFGIGILNAKKPTNLGTLWRSANTFGANFIFTIGRRYEKQASDTLKTPRHIPLYHYADFQAFYSSMPYDTQLVGVELSDRAIPLPEFVHPARCIYLLGAEDNGLTREAMDKCVHLVEVPTVQAFCLNVASTGTLVMYDRLQQNTMRMAQVA